VVHRVSVSRTDSRHSIATAPNIEPYQPPATVLQAMTFLNAVFVLVPSIGLAFMWFMIGRFGNKSYWHGYDTGRKDGFEEGRMAAEQALCVAFVIAAQNKSQSTKKSSERIL
jgi:hypothetical protein